MIPARTKSGELLDLGHGESGGRGHRGSRRHRRWRSGHGDCLSGLVGVRGFKVDTCLLVCGGGLSAVKAWEPMSPCDRAMLATLRRSETSDCVSFRPRLFVGWACVCYKVGEKGVGVSVSQTAEAVVAGRLTTWRKRGGVQDVTYFDGDGSQQRRRCPAVVIAEAGRFNGPGEECFHGCVQGRKRVSMMPGYSQNCGKGKREVVDAQLVQGCSYVYTLRRPRVQLGFILGISLLSGSTSDV